MVKLTIVALLILAGCSSVPARNPEFSAVDAAPLTQSIGLQSLDTKVVGESVEINDTRYTLVERYRAASGRDCRKLLDEKAGDFRVACRSSSQGWYLRKALSTRMSVHREQAIKVERTRQQSIGELSESQTADEHSVALLPGENLWRFSKRVTGNAKNWHAIASHNDIANVATLKVGQKLSLPHGLVAPSTGN